ncbi:MAG: cytochrome-c oxidase, cbb3-type subunit III [Alphaproteobacteria bacterium]
MPTKAEKDAIARAVDTEQATTGHEWDGIREYDTPLPKWWLYLLYATILVAIAMFVLFPSIPGITGYFGGLLDRQERRVFAETMGRAAEGQAGMRSAISDATPAEVAADPEMLAFAIAGGRTAFADNCAPCHGPGGGGQQGGYPVLADDDWLWGGSLDEIAHSIRAGVRHEDLDTRVSEMPPFGTAGLLDRGQVTDVADYVLSLSGRDHDPVRAERGAPIYADNCLACHGERGSGDPVLGAPRLDDQIWLYGDSRDDIVSQIWSPRHGVMPAWGTRLDQATLNMLTVYVHSLGGGQ